MKKGLKFKHYDVPYTQLLLVLWFVLLNPPHHLTTLQYQDHPNVQPYLHLIENWWVLNHNEPQELADHDGGIPIAKATSIKMFNLCMISRKELWEYNYFSRLPLGMNSSTKALKSTLQQLLIILTKFRGECCAKPHTQCQSS